MSRVVALIIAVSLLAGCAAQSAALPPTQPPIAPSVTALPPPTAAPPTATAEPPTAEPPTATPMPPTATAEPPTAIPIAAPPVRLVIPAIDLDRELFSVGLDENRVPIVPQHDVGWYNLSAQPGEGENIVLWGHVLRFKAKPKVPAPFARMKELAIGAPLTLHSADGSARDYVVIDQVLVTPDQVKYILPQGRELVTLVSCIGDKVVVNSEVEMTHRLITIAAPAD